MSNLQTALERALPILAAAYGEQFGVNVVLSGNVASTHGETIILPMLDNMSELKDVLFGYLAHEAAHIRYSDVSTLRKCKNKSEAGFTNIIEDIRIERLIQDVFPGTQFTLNAVMTHAAQMDWSPAATLDDNEATQLHQYLIHRLNVEELNREAFEPLYEASRRVVETTFPEGFFIRLDGLLAKYMPTLKSSDDCLTLTRAILRALKESEEEAVKHQQQDQPNGNDSSQGGQSQLSNDPCAGVDDSQPQDSHANASGEDDGDQPDGDPKPDGKAHQGQRSNDTGRNSLSSTHSSQDDQGVSENGCQASKHQRHERVARETDLPGDVMDKLKTKLTEQAKKDNNGKPFEIHAGSIGSDAQNHGNPSSLIIGVLSSSTIRARLLGLLQAQTREKQWLHTKGTRVDGKRITRLVGGDSRVFIHREDIKRPDTAVHVLLDCSGSMNRIQDVANQATVSLAMAISSIPKCDIATSMFPGLGGAVSPILRRGQPIRPNLGRFAVVSHGGTPLAEAMLFAVRELATSRRERKVLIIITDGDPSKGASVQYISKLIEGHIDTYAIGIGSTAVKQYFKKWSVINNVNELQHALFTIAGKFLDLH